MNVIFDLMSALTLRLFCIYSYLRYVSYFGKNNIFRLGDSLPRTSECVNVPPLGRIQGPQSPLTVSARGQECTLTCHTQQFVCVAEATAGHAVAKHQSFASVALLKRI